MPLARNIACKETHIRHLDKVDMWPLDGNLLKPDGKRSRKNRLSPYISIKYDLD